MTKPAWREWWTNYMAMGDSQSAAREHWPKQEWDDIRCYVERNEAERAYQALEQRLAESEARQKYLEERDFEGHEKEVAAAVSKRFEKQIADLTAENERLKAELAGQKQCSCGFGQSGRPPVIFNKCSKCGGWV